jgi:uncharacterized membrane protein YkoI
MSKQGLFGLMLAATIALGGCAMNGKHHHDEGDDDKETPVAMDQLPAPVKATLMKEAGGGKVDEVVTEMHNGKKIYEADVTADGKKWEIQISEDGQLLKKKLEHDHDDDEHHEKT